VIVQGGTTDASDSPPRVALVHDFLVGLRGADRVFLQMCDMWPEADIFTTIYDEPACEGRFDGRNVHTSFLQRLRPTRRTFRALLPLYPAAVESFDLSSYDLVVSSSSGWAHAVIVDERTVHVSYCHNPFRYAWNERQRTLAERGNPVTRAALRGFFRRWREWDWLAAQRVDRYLTNSKTTQARIKTYFGRSSRIVHPPVELDRFSVGEPQDYYLVLSELVSHKRINDAVEAFTSLGLPLVVAGDGPDSRRLRSLAGPNIHFAGRVSDAEAARLLTGCRAFIQTAVEEFGIAAVEAQASGRPVIARRGGGALETVMDQVTGCYWVGGADQLAQAVRTFDADAIDPAACVEHARRFDSAAFRSAFFREVERAMADAASDPEGDSRERRTLARRRMPGTRLTRGSSPR
jgi:glycosyltransferase involved in cell wall biosynthesis